MAKKSSRWGSWRVNEPPSGWHNNKPEIRRVTGEDSPLPSRPSGPSIRISYRGANFKPVALAPRKLTVYTSRSTSVSINRLDIRFEAAASSMEKVLAPTFEMMQALRNGRLTQTEFVEAYLNLLRHRYSKNKKPFLNILHRKQVTLYCTCVSKDCHRYIARDVLHKIAKHHDFEFVDGGELE